MEWRPSATQETVRNRNLFIAKIRSFFTVRNTLEVETPLLAAHGTQTPEIDSFSILSEKQPYFLQSSPEYHMKRLLAAGFPSIFQITKAFRRGEAGHNHNPEFTMIEWYRIDASASDLMNETNDLLTELLGITTYQKMTYQECFLEFCALDPFTMTKSELEATLTKNRIDWPQNADKNTLESLCFSCLIEPQFKNLSALWITEYPLDQAALAKQNPDKPHTALRFELYINGIEIANGFEELACPKEQLSRFEQEKQIRLKEKKAAIPICTPLIEALESGLPSCAGIALGIDRLFMLKQSFSNIADVLLFPWSRA